MKKNIFPQSPNRRNFLSRVGGATAATVAANAVGLPALTLLGDDAAQAAEVGPHSARQRRTQAFLVRLNAARHQKHLPLPPHPTNGDEELYPNQIGSYSKALRHNGFGEVELAGYNALVRAMSTGRNEDFEAIPLGGTAKLASPQAAFAFDLIGPDSHQLGMLPPPAFSSAEEAGEMAELYWHALTRDVHFSDYATHPLTIQAAANLSQFSDFRGPKVGNQVTSDTLFRGNTPGDLVGPYISQFLFRDYPYGATRLRQMYSMPQPGVDFMTTPTSWLNIQNGGAAPPVPGFFDPTLRLIRNGRDLGEYVHRDFTYQGFLNAALILLGFGPAALDPNNPYLNSQTQSGFVTFGAANVLDVVTSAANASLRAAWYQKWSVHRRLRPEEFGGRVHYQLTGARNYPLHADLVGAGSPGRQTLDLIFGQHGTYFLPIAFPEGCPTHPAYPAGHATIAGACVTILKAFFNGDFVIPNPQVASADGLTLEAYSGPALTVRGELNKLAANIAIGRDIAGVHWRSDGIEGLNLGEAVALGILTDLRATFNEVFPGFKLQKFDGTSVTI